MLLMGTCFPLMSRNPGRGTLFLGVGSRLHSQAKPSEPATSPDTFKAPFLLESSLQPSPGAAPHGAGKGQPCQASRCQWRQGHSSSCYYSQEIPSARHTLAEDKSQPTHNAVTPCLSPAASGQKQVKLQKMWGVWSLALLQLWVDPQPCLHWNNSQPTSVQLAWHRQGQSRALELGRHLHHHCAAGLASFVLLHQFGT